MESLPQTIDTFFSSLVPAIWQLVISLFVIYFLVNKRYWKVVYIKFKKFNKSIEGISSNNLVKETGILKLVPVFLLVAVIALSIGFQKASFTIGGWIPGQLGWNQPSLMVNAVPEDSLASIWHKHKGIEDLHMLWNLIQFETLKANKEYTVKNPSGWAIHDKIFHEYIKDIYFSKFLMLFSCILVLWIQRNKVGHIHVKKRLMLVLVSCLIYILYSFVNQIEAKKQSEMAKIIHINMKLQVKREKPLKPEDFEGYAEKIRKYKGKHSVEFLAGFYISK